MIPGLRGLFRNGSLLTSLPLGGVGGSEKNRTARSPRQAEISETRSKNLAASQLNQHI